MALLLITLLALIGVASGGTVSRMPDISSILVASSIQAGLSTVFSLTIGLGLAWAFNRLRFFGRDTAVGLLSAALVTPGLVVVFGLLAVWGRAGWINTLLEPFDLRLPSISGCGASFMPMSSSMRPSRRRCCCRGSTGCRRHA